MWSYFKKIKISPLLIVLIVISIYFGEFNVFISYFLAITLHELSHSIVAKKLGYHSENIVLSLFGAKLNLRGTILSTKDEIKICLAGPICNIILCFISGMLIFFYGNYFMFLKVFFMANLVTGVFNLFPLIPLDGSRFILALFSKYGLRYKAYKVLKSFNIIVSIMFIIIFIYSCFAGEINIGYLCLSIFCIISINNDNEEMDYMLLNNFVQSKKINCKKLKVRHFAVGKDYPINKMLGLINENYYLIIDIVDENLVIIKSINEGEIKNLLCNNIK